MWVGASDRWQEAEGALPTGLAGREWVERAAHSTDTQPCRWLLRTALAPLSPILLLSLSRTDVNY